MLPLSAIRSSHLGNPGLIKTPSGVSTAIATLAPDARAAVFAAGAAAAARDGGSHLTAVTAMDNATRAFVAVCAAHGAEHASDG